MIDPNLICMNCMNELTQEGGVCPHCGFDNGNCANSAHQLQCGSIIAGTYLIGCALGQGGFGITYIGFDLNLGIRVAIKEYYPEGNVTRDMITQATVLVLSNDKRAQFEAGKDRFVQEARVLARFAGEKGIVGVRSFFHENGTAYIVMDYIEGETLKSYAANSGGKLPAQKTLRFFRPLCDSIARVHAAGLLHRDISPDNIILRPDGVLTLIDFGAARQISAYGEHSNTINVKHGFAPEEQYRTRGEQGPWTDVYALSATIYRLITGFTPPQALDRLTSGAAITPPRQLGADLTPAQENALLHGLGVNAQYRTRDMLLLIQELYSKRAPLETASPDKQVLLQPQRTNRMSAAPAREESKKIKQSKRNITTQIIVGASLGVFLFLLILIGALLGAETLGQTTQSDFGDSAGAAAVVDANSTTDEPLPKATTEPDPAAQSLSPTVTPKQDDTPEPAPKTPSPEQIASAVDGTLNSSGVALHSGPATTYAMIGKYSGGTQLKVYEAEGDYFFVCVVKENLMGYVEMKFVDKVGIVHGESATSMPEDIAGTIPGTVNVSKLALRSVPSTEDNTPIGQLENGDAVLIYFKTGDFYYIQVAATGAKCYAAAKYITASAAVPTGTPVPNK